MDRILPRRLAASTLLFASLTVAPAAHAMNGKPAIDRDTIVFGTGKEISNLDAQVAATSDSQRCGWQLYDTLYAFDAKGNVEPSVAIGYKVSADGLTYTFTLRRDVKFHNGVLLTAKDVKYSVERILEPTTKSTRRPYFAGLIDGVDAPNDTTVVMRLKRGDGAFINKIAGYLALVPKAYTEGLGSPEAFARAPIGSGPYRFVEQKIGQGVELARFDGYWGKKPGIKRLLFKSIPDATSRVNALLASEVDIVDYIAPADVDRLKKTDGVLVKSAPVGSPLAVRIYSNVPGSPLAKRDVRLAMNHAVDTQAIVKNVLHGVGAPLSSYISASYPYGVDPTLKPYVYDRALAKKELTAAGYPNGFDTELLCPSDNPKELCEVIAAYWTTVGIRAQVKVIDYAAWSRLNNTHKSGPLTMMQFANAIYDPVHPISGAATKGGTWSDYDNPEVEKLIEQGDTEIDRGKRDAIFRRVGRLLHDDGHAVLITELYYTFGQDAKVEWEPQFGSGYYNLRNVRWKP